MFRDGDVDVPSFEERPPEDVEYAGHFKRHDDIHFLLSSATVRDEGREVLRMFAATELAAFRDPASEVLVDGFADRLGREWFNDALSRARAENTLQALADCLGADYAPRSEVRSHGEKLLKFFAFPDDSGRPEWRRVFVTLNGVARVTLSIRDLKDLQ